MNKKLYNLLLLSAALLFASSCNNNSEEPAPIPEPPMICPSDSLVMVDFYHSMKGDEWERPWDLTNPKTWHGITGMWNEEKQYYEIYRMDITKDICGSNGAKLPESIGRLKKLTHLIIGDCHGLTGNIPESLYDCPLETLDITFCPGLQGPLSHRIGDLSNTLKHLCISANRSFSSELSKELGKCTKLLYINLSANKFYGKIPIELKNCRREMFLNQNQFSELDWEWFIDEDILIFPDMRNNNFSGEIPTEVTESKHWKKRRNYIYPFNEGYGFANVEDYS
ncbi:MAG: hypothetical protein IJB61_03850 [Bacteroides sp]|nr:hypothetical protein [Bacteroides sp.]